MWHHVCFPLLRLVVGWPWGRELIPEPVPEVNLTDTPDEDGGPKLNKTATQEGIFWWFEGAVWGFWRQTDATNGGDEAPWLGSPDCPASLRAEGGWAGYFIDGIGVQAFGSWWPWAAYIIMVSFNTGLLDPDLQSAHTDWTMSCSWERTTSGTTWSMLLPPSRWTRSSPTNGKASDG